MSGTMIGVISMQVPIAWLADRLSRTRVLMICHAVTITALVAILPGGSVLRIAVCLFLAGACSSAFYPLGLARLGEQVSVAALPSASAWFLGINCIGSLTGPVVSGIAMDYLGPSALIGSGMASVVLILGVWAFLRFVGRQSQSANPESVHPTYQQAA
jgi:MFS family permease